MSNAENMNHSPAPATEEEKSKLLEALRKFWELIKYQLTHSSHGMLLQQVERMADAIEESLEQNALNQEKVQELTELFSSVQGEMATITPEKIKEVLENAQSIMADDLFLTPQVDKTDFFETISSNLKSIYDAKGKDFPEEIEKSLQEKAKFIDAGKDNSLLIEYDGVLLQATYLPTEKKIHLEYTNVTLSDIANEDGSLIDGYQRVERQIGSLEQDLTKALCDKRNIPYEFDKEAVQAKMLEKLSPVGEFVFSRSKRLTDKETGESFNEITVTENGRYESHYYTGDNSFRIRDTDTNKTISVVAEKGKIEFYVAESTAALPQTATDRGMKIGQITQEGKDIHTHLTFGDVSIASMFYSEELTKYLALSGIDEKQQREMLTRKEDASWSKVEDAGMEKVEQLREACRKVCSRQGQYHVSVQNTNSNYTFLVVSQKKGLGNANPAISFAFDKNGDVKAINFRESGTVERNGKETNHKYRYMHSFVTKSVSADFHRLQDNPEFVSLYRLAMESLAEAGIDTSRSRMQTKKNMPITSSPQVYFDIIPEKDLELKPSADNYTNERYFATQVAKAASYAFEHGKLSMADLKRVGVDNEYAKPVMGELVKLGVVAGKLNTKETRTTSDLFARKFSEIAESPQVRENYVITGHTESYIAFLPQAYKKHIENEQQTAFEKLDADAKIKVVMAMEKILSDMGTNKPIEVSESYFQPAFSFGDAHRTLNNLKAMGVVNYGVTLTAKELESRLSECKSQVVISLDTLPQKTLESIDDFLAGKSSFEKDELIHSLAVQGHTNAEFIAESVYKQLLSTETIGENGQVLNGEEKSSLFGKAKTVFAKDALADSLLETKMENEHEEYKKTYKDEIARIHNIEVLPLSEIPDDVIKTADEQLYQRVSEFTVFDAGRLATLLQDEGVGVAESKQYAYSIFASMVTEGMIDRKQQAAIGEEVNGRYHFTEHTLSDYVKAEREKNVLEAEKKSAKTQEERGLD